MGSKVVINSKIGKVTVSRYTYNVVLVHIWAAVYGLIRAIIINNNEHIQQDKKVMKVILDGSPESSEAPEASTGLDSGILIGILILIHLTLALVLLASTIIESLACLRTWLVMEAISTALDTGLVILAGMDYYTSMVAAFLIVRPFCFYVVCRRIKDIKMSSPDDTLHILAPQDA